MAKMWHRHPFLIRMTGTFDRRGDWISPPNGYWVALHRRLSELGYGCTIMQHDGEFWRTVCHQYSRTSAAASSVGEHKDPVECLRQAIEGQLDPLPEDVHEMLCRLAISEVMPLVQTNIEQVAKMVAFADDLHSKIAAMMPTLEELVGES